MSGVLLICVSLMVSAGAAGDLDMDALPFSVNEVVEQASRSTRLNYRENLSMDGRGSTTSWPLLDEFMIDTSITYVGATYGQVSPSVVCDGSNCLVVWGDPRSQKWDIYAARVDSSGTVLDPSGIVISILGKLHPSAAFDGTNYLVVWEDWWLGYPDCDVYGARVDPTGTVLDTSGIAISSASGCQEYPSVSFDGADYFVVWQDDRSGGDADIYGARVSTSGTVLDPSGIAVSIANDKQELPRVASDGNNLLVVWEDWRNQTTTIPDIYGARVDTSGTVLDSAGIPISTDSAYEWGPYVTFGATSYFVVWADRRSDTMSYDIYGIRIDTSGIVLDTAAITISAVPGPELAPSVAFHGINHFVTWLDHRSGTYSDIYGARVGTSGTVVDLSGIAISSGSKHEKDPSVAFNATNYFVAWTDGRGALEDDIYGARVDTSGTVLDSLGVPISTSAHPQWNPEVTFDGTNYLVLWEDQRSGLDRDIYGCRVGDSGALIDSAGMDVSTAVDHQLSPCGAFGGTDYLVVWQDYRSSSDFDIYCARMDISGNVLDPSGIAVCVNPEDQEVPSIAFDGRNYLVVWQDYRSGSDSDIYGARVDTFGTILDPAGIAICAEPNGQYSPWVDFDGTNYFVVWEDRRTGRDIYGSRVDTSGAVLDSEGIAISTSDNDAFSPSSAFDGTNYLVVWMDVASDSCRIWVARVNQSGNVLDTAGIDVAGPSAWMWHPSAEFDGSNYLVVWEESGTWIGESDIRGARVDISGAVLDSGGIELASYFYGRWNPSIAAGSDGQLFLVYDGFADEPYNTNRVFGAFYTETGIAERKAKIKNQNAKLFQNRPNPFYSQTEIQYDIPASGHTSVKLYDSSGRLVKVLVDGKKRAGSHTSWWHGKDSSGQEVPSGVYFCRLQADEFVSTRKMILVR